MMKAPVCLTLLLLSAFALAPAAQAEEKKQSATVIGGPYEVTVIKDIAYNDTKDADPVKHKLDLYLPKGQKNFPVLFYVHGGAWRAGDRKGVARLGTLIARNGIGCVAISYRLSPKVKHPAHIEDVAKAFAWTHKNIARHGGDVKNIFISGHSAGGHLVALLATNDRYLKAEKLGLGDIKGALPLSGIYTIRPFGGLKAAFGDAEQCKDASPLQHVKEKHPPFLIAYADDDLRGCGAMSKELCKALKKAKCEAEVMEIESRNHGTILFKAATNVDDPLTQAMLKFISKHSGLKLTEKKEEK
jgi:acetyl esterase/lipase